jgi:hypothetical protein
VTILNLVTLFVPLKSDLDAQQTHLNNQFVEQQVSKLVPALHVTIIVSVTINNMVTLFVPLKSDLVAPHTHLSGQFVEQNFMLSSSITCDHNYICDNYELVLTLLCHLSQTWILNKPTSVTSLSNKFMLSSSFARDPNHICNNYEFQHTLLCHLSQTWLLNKPTSVTSLLKIKVSCSASGLHVIKIMCNNYELSHTLLCHLSQTWMFSKPTIEESLLNKSSCSAPTLGVTKFMTIIGMNLVSPCCAA